MPDFLKKTQTSGLSYGDYGKPTHFREYRSICFLIPRNFEWHLNLWRGKWRCIPELANHRTPIKNLYATGSCWHPGANASSAESYNCYKIIAKDMNLPKPWEEYGKEEPDSLVEQMNIITRRIGGS